MPLNKSINHDGGKHVWRHKRCLPCKHASYGWKCQEHDGLKVKREEKRKSENIKGVHAFFLLRTVLLTAICGEHLVILIHGRKN